MGYYVDCTESKLRFKGDAPDERMLAEYVKEKMFTDEALKTKASGGSYPRPTTKDYDATKYHWYSWTDSMVCRKAETVWEIIDEFVDEIVMNEDGSWQIIFSSKTGQEDVLFETLAPFMEPGSYANWTGEDDSHWRWEFDGEKMITRQGEVVYR